ncbi:Peptidyl-tRNA hydrolase [Planktothrix agardhii]|jgi:PTH1 family peptidyl-tRNA hydrolase|uniref:Peptidyl-tRNA hydrolase n=2 Tax=Planktothrix agardhii TaxID=1160 RepID=A0A1J1JJQ1_PLAAG|nr:Peptidyl-tRNA hydrolase [Planktothrix agardhii]CUM60460.1 Peptidyl-tRNA hydrolase [Planktothrix agardhii]
MIMEVTPAKILIFPQLIVGLGNPETKYEQTRHNIGFEAIDALAKAWRIPISENRKFKGKFGEGVTSSGEKIRLLKPLTYMNLSGQAIRAVVDWYKLPPTSVLVIYDDMDLPLGRLRLRLSGSAGGHNGMRSTISHLGTQNFPRLRIGIGKPKSMAGTIERETVSYVLGKFSSPEMQIMEQVLKWAGEAIDLSLHQGVEKAMSLYNNRSFVDSTE